MVSGVTRISRLAFWTGKLEYLVVSWNTCAPPMKLLIVLAGAGKTILAYKHLRPCLTVRSRIINYLESRFAGEEHAAVLYFYFNYKDEGQTSANFLGSLLQQLLLVQQKLPISDEILAIYQKHLPRKTRPSFHEYSKILQSQLAAVPHVF